MREKGRGEGEKKEKRKGEYYEGKSKGHSGREGLGARGMLFVGREAITGDGRRIFGEIKEDGKDKR